VCGYPLSVRTTTTGGMQVRTMLAPMWRDVSPQHLLDSEVWRAEVAAQLAGGGVPRAAVERLFTWPVEGEAHARRTPPGTGNRP
jgi:hypothetical protein